MTFYQPLQGSFTYHWRSSDTEPLLEWSCESLCIPHPGIEPGLTACRASMLPTRPPGGGDTITIVHMDVFYISTIQWHTDVNQKATLKWIKHKKFQIWQDTIGLKMVKRLWDSTWWWLELVWASRPFTPQCIQQQPSDSRKCTISQLKSCMRTFWKIIKIKVSRQCR